VLASETERAQALLLRRFGEAPPDDARELARRVRFLLSRGFATELALRLVKGSRK
jgi:regulatory protein